MPSLSVVELQARRLRYIIQERQADTGIEAVRIVLNHHMCGIRDFDDFWQPGMQAIIRSTISRVIRSDTPPRTISVGQVILRKADRGPLRRDLALCVDRRSRVVDAPRRQPPCLAAAAISSRVYGYSFSDARAGMKAAA